MTILGEIFWREFFAGWLTIQKKFDGNLKKENFDSL